jgi:hypothetical protein
MGKVTKRVGRVTRKTLKKAKAKALEMVGRAAVKSKTRRAKAIAGKAAKEALIAGAITAAGVVVNEIRKRRS